MAAGHELGEGESCDVVKVTGRMTRWKLAPAKRPGLGAAGPARSPRGEHDDFVMHITGMTPNRPMMTGVGAVGR